MIKTCELYLNGTFGECGAPAVHVFHARLVGFDWQPFYACRLHKTRLLNEIAEDGLEVQAA